MFKIPLEYSIHTLDGKELVSAGTALTENVIKEIIVSNSDSLADSMPLMQFELVKEDIFDFLLILPIKLFLIITRIQRMS
jgi:hypothetical protein